MRRLQTVLSVAVAMTANTALASDRMQVCQMTDILVWDIEKGFDIEPTEVEEFAEPYDVLINEGKIYDWTTVNDSREALTPIDFDMNGKAQYKGYLWFKVSETEFRILDQEFGAVYHSKLTCPDKM